MTPRGASTAATSPTTPPWARRRPMSTSPAMMRCRSTTATTMSGRRPAGVQLNLVAKEAAMPSPGRSTWTPRTGPGKPTTSPRS
ncbi:MAG: hypothetical protein MZV64_11445 [Ignavibacteriales bacterium]|nr:hypothetical protein [Ignavibacteriales bacterium]